MQRTVRTGAAGVENGVKLGRTGDVAQFSPSAVAPNLRGNLPRRRNFLRAPKWQMANRKFESEVAPNLRGKPWLIVSIRSIRHRGRQSEPFMVAFGPCIHVLLGKQPFSWP